MLNRKAAQGIRRRSHILRSGFAVVVLAQWAIPARSAPLYTLTSGGDPAVIELGRSLFNTEWVPAGIAGQSVPAASRTEGVGPLFNSASCAGCHDRGEGGPGPVGDGLVPISLEIQLDGDPVYGHVFNTAATPGVRAEGRVTVRYGEIYGYYYPDGTRWRVRVPHYQFTELSHGPLLGTTVIKPRIAPPLFGVGLLEMIPEQAIDSPTTDEGGAPVGVAAWHVRQGARSLGRFGWQGDALSVRDQTTRAMAGEMGLTSVLQPRDDCTLAETECLGTSTGLSPEVSEERVDALVAFARSSVVPAPTPGDDESRFGYELFKSIGCAACHRPRVPVTVVGVDGQPESAFIEPYTDLRLHNLGNRMSDETVSGQKVTSLWRTPPLWGLAYRLESHAQMTYLHDGRARSAEEAILWHGGEAARSRRNFMNMGPRSRKALLHWVESR